MKNPILHKNNSTREMQDFTKNDRKVLLMFQGSSLICYLDVFRLWWLTDKARGKTGISGWKTMKTEKEKLDNVTGIYIFM